MCCPHWPLAQVRLDIPGSGDCELDVWMYQHYCEVSKIPFTIGGLVPADKTPDRPTVMRLLLFALNMGSTSEFTGLISLCVKVLKQNLLTETLIRAMNSDAVFQEYSLLSPAEKAPLLCALASMQSLRQRAIRYASEPLINTLQSLRDFLQRIDGVFLRSNGLIAAKEAVPSVPWIQSYDTIWQLGLSVTFFQATVALVVKRTKRRSLRGQREKRFEFSKGFSNSGSECLFKWYQVVYIW